jgi:hypothetical protein
VNGGTHIVARSWSVVAVGAIFALILYTQSEPTRAVASVICIGLLIQSWFMQRRYARSAHRLWLLSLALCVPALASVWLGLNVVRFYSYPGDSESKVYLVVTRLQSGIEWCGAALATVVVLWAIFELAHSLAKRISPKTILL